MEIPSLKPWNPDAEKIFQQVFGRHTLLTLDKFMNDGVFARLYGEVKQGKEANIFIAEDAKGKLMCVKIYRVETATFGNFMDYLKGDTRFESVGRKKKDIIHAWAKKEYSNLLRLEAAGVRVPHPMAFRNNVLVMEWIEKDGENAPTLQEADVDEPRKILDTLLEEVRLAYAKAKLVHADLSQYNVLVETGGKPVIIDCAQAVLTSHPKATEFLKRDLNHLISFFRRRYQVEKKTEEAFLEVTK